MPCIILTTHTILLTSTLINEGGWPLHKCGRVVSTDSDSNLDLNLNLHANSRNMYDMHHGVNNMESQA